MTANKILTSMSLAMVGLLQRLEQGPVALDEVNGPLLKGLRDRGLVLRIDDMLFVTWSGQKLLNNLEEQ